MQRARYGKLLAVTLLAALTFGQSPQIPSWWLSSDPKRVLADPLFHTLFVNQRIQILSQIDPKFAKLSFDKQDAYLWNAETANLPKAEPPKRLFAWNAMNPNSTADFPYQNRLTRSMEAAGFRVQATLERNGFFISHVRVENKANGPVLVRPQTFVLNVSKPKTYALYFEHPLRVWWQTTKGFTSLSPTYIPTERTTVRSGNTGRAVATIDSPDQAAKQEIKDMYTQMQKWGYEYVKTIVPNSLTESTLAANAAVEGDVYFEMSDKAREVVLRVFLGDTAFEFPFSIPKK